MHDDRNLPAAPATAALRRAVFAAYGRRQDAPPCPCVLDQLIPRELAGATVAANLWPQTAAEARLKDRLENRLRREVCDGVIPLAAAQQEIARDWG